MKKVRFAAVVLAGSVGFVALTATASAQSSVIPPSAHPYGASYSEWTTRWTRWLFEAPRSRSPLVRPTNCGINPDPFPSVRFLGPPPGPGRFSVSCRVRAGTPIFISPAGTICTGATDRTYSARALRRCVRGGLAAFRGVVVTLDGRRISRYLTFTPRFLLRLPENDLFGASVRETPALLGGWFAMIRPLAPGVHRMRAVARVQPPGEDVLVIQMDYTLRVFSPVTLTGRARA